MEYNRIMAITGLPGLFELLSSKADGAIVRSLDDKTTKFVSSRVHNFSHLESIEVYTTRENVNLVEVFTAIQNNGSDLPSEKDAAAIKAFFQKVYPDLDFDRVYVSDMKKMIKWYSVLKDNNVEIKLSEVAEEELQEEETVVAEAAPAIEAKKEDREVKEQKQEVKEEKNVAEEQAPAKKTAKAKKTATDDEDGVEVAAKAPAKKTAKKTAAKEDGDSSEEKPKKTTTRKKKTEE